MTRRPWPAVRSATVRRSARVAGTVLLAVAGWTALAIAVPVVATGDVAALVVIVAVAVVVAASSRRGAGRRVLPLALIAAASTALLIFLVISSVLPAVPGFVAHNHPPIYRPVTRMVDPVTELAVFVLLTVALGVDGLRYRIRSRQVAARKRRPAYAGGPNEMVVEPTGGTAGQC